MVEGPSTLIIRRSYRHSTGGRLASLALAVGYWGWLAYLLKGLMVFVGWGSALGLTNVIASGTSAEVMLRQIVFTYIPLILGLAMLLWGWGFYNWLRFSGTRDKRCGEKTSCFSLEEISSACFLEVDDLKRLRKGRLNMCHFDGHGNICGVASITDKGSAGCHVSGNGAGISG